MKKIATMLFVLVLVAGCGKNEVKQVSQESKISREAFTVAEAIRASYVKRDFSGIAEKCTKDGYKDIIDSIKHFDSVSLEFIPRWVEIEGSKVYLNVSWKGVWRVGDDTTRERGMAVFLLEGKPLKLSKVIRGNPFQYPER